MSEIKPCPFCGANPHQGLGKVQHCSLHGEPFQRFHIKCPKGHAEISAPNRERAVEGWNTRPVEDDLTASLNRASDACASVQKERDELREELATALRLMHTVRHIAIIAHGHWDSDEDLKVGKLLLALSGMLSKYRSDIDEIHAFLARYEAMK